MTEKTRYLFAGCLKDFEFVISTMATKEKLNQELDLDPGTFYRCKCGVGAFGTDIAAHLRTHDRVTGANGAEWISEEDLD